MENPDLKIREACFNLCSTLMWRKGNLSIESASNEMTELNEMTEKFYENAKFILENTESLQNEHNIMTRAIKYIEQVHSLPPLRGNVEWFYFTLTALMEIARPNSCIIKENLLFLKDLEFGIEDYRINVDE
jgi:hypothetical protein